MGLGRNAMEVGNAAAKVGGDAIQKAQGLGFLEVREATAGVDHSANVSLQAVQKAPDIAIKMTTAGINAGIDAAKVVLTATGVGAPVTAAIDAVQTAVNHGIEKIQEGAKEGTAVVQKATSNMHWVTDPTHAGPMKDGVEELRQEVKGITGKVERIGQSVASVTKGSSTPEGGGGIGEVIKGLPFSTGGRLFSAGAGLGNAVGSAAMNPESDAAVAEGLSQTSHAVGGIGQNIKRGASEHGVVPTILLPGAKICSV